MTVDYLTDIETIAGGGGFFKPGDHIDARALLFEPKHVELDVDNEYKGKVTKRDEVTADVTVFRDGEPLVLEGVTIGHGGLTKPLKKIIGGATVAKLAQISTANGRPFVLNKAEADDVAKVVAYIEKRDADLKAAVDAAPSFA